MQNDTDPEQSQAIDSQPPSQVDKSEQIPSSTDTSDASETLTNDLPTQLTTQLPTPARGSAWLLGIVAVYFLATMLYLMGFGGYLGVTLGPASLDKGSIEQMIQEHIVSPNGIFGTYLLQFLLVVPLILLISNFSKQSWRQTLALSPVSTKVLGYWVCVWLVYQFGFIVLNMIVEVETDDFILQMQGNRHLGMLFTIVVLAPIMEELVFRGYLFKAWRHSWLGFYGTLLLTSVLFCVIHAGQYGWMGLSQVFILALILGCAREKTGSIMTSIVLHALNNLVAAVLIMFMSIAV